MIKLSPSILCANFSCLEKQIRELEKGGADFFHFDVGDGNFVPIITMGPMILASLKKITKIPFDIHLQIKEPQKQIDNFINAGADIIIVHIEECIDIFRIIKKIKEKGLKAGIALNPITPISNIGYIIEDLDYVLVMTVDTGLVGQSFIPQTLNKIEKIRRRIENEKLKTEIMVDGSINKNTIPKVVEAGANILVLGSSGLFNKNGNLTDKMKELRCIAESN